MAVLAFSIPLALVGGVAWSLAARLRVTMAIGTLVQSALAVLGTLFIASVAAETDPATMRARIRRPDAGTFTYSAVALAGLAVVMLVVARRTRRRDVAVGGFLCSSVAAILQFLALLANALVN